MSLGSSLYKILAAILSVVIVVTIAGVVLLRVVLPKAIASAFTEGRVIERFMDADEKAEFDAVLNEAVIVLDEYGLSPRQAHDEIEEVTARDFRRALDSLRNDPPASNAEAIRRIVSGLDIEGLDTEKLIQDLGPEMPPNMFVTYINEDEFRFFEGVGLTLGFPAAKETALQLLRQHPRADF